MPLAIKAGRCYRTEWPKLCAQSAHRVTQCQMKTPDYQEQVFSWELLLKEKNPKLSQLCPFKVNTKKTLVKLMEGDDLLMEPRAKEISNKNSVTFRFDGVTSPDSLQREPSKKMHWVSYCDSEADKSHGNLIVPIPLGCGACVLLFLIRTYVNRSKYART